MENLKVKELIEIYEELGLTLGRAKRKQAILEIMKKEGVTAEEVDEAWADIKGRREEADRRELQPSTSLAAKDRQKRRVKLVDTSWQQASGSGILPEEWDVFTERSQQPSVRRALEVNLDGPGERARPASEPRGSSSSFRRLGWRQGCCNSRALNSNLHCSGKIFKLVERLMQVASTSADCLMQSTATLAVRLTQSTAVPHAPARQALSPTGRIPASNQRRFLIGGFDLLADARGQKGL
ncbi:hypothetical protein HPB50_012677 [Hyalomma asiaticum]|uniref:Uncharacterized protein n=1 Tax=Hyalomma asiaticum TaxID=266040 RepID=A0ACB7S0S8_HYAAI|nr:hypothetical protein HPB50_012677 [Hyalomma asiaticum]